MAVSISINLAENSYSTTNNTSNVTVQVTASYTAGSYNQTSPGPELTVTVDGSSTTCNVGFNAGQNTSGTDIIYTDTYTIAHDSDGTKTLYCSASYVTGVSSGTVTASKSLVLTTITQSSGGGSESGGGDSGGDSGGSSDSGSTNDTHTLTISQGEHTTISIFDGTMHSGGESYYGALKSGDVFRDGDDLDILFKVDRGYKLLTHTVNGNTFNSGTYENANNDLLIESSASPYLLDAELAFAEFSSCIGQNLIVVSRSISYDYTGEGNNESPHDVTSYDRTEYNIDETQVLNLKSYYSSVGKYSKVTCVAVIFTTPDAQTCFDSIKFEFKLGENVFCAHDIKYAVTVRDSSFAVQGYVFGGTVFDYTFYEICNGDVDTSGWVANTTNTLNISSLSLEPNNTYSLILYIPDLEEISNDSIDLYYRSLSVGNITGLVYLDSGAGYDNVYQCYIDNGTSWDPYIPYIDNGTSWDICT